MTSADATPSTMILAEGRYRLSLCLLVVSVVTLACTWLAPRALVTDAVFWLLLFVLGMFSGIIWCKLALRPR
jgi:hypothetical protein